MPGDTKNRWEQLDWLKGDGPSPPPRAGMPTPEPPRTEIDYRPPVGKLLLGAALAVLGAIFMGHLAQTNDCGLIINGIVELSSSGATWFYWAVGGVMLAFVVAALLLVPRSMVRRPIVIESDSITLPSRGYSRRTYRIGRDDIRAVTVTQYQKMRYIKIHHLGGVRPINSTWLPHEGDADTILRWLEAGQRPAARPPSPAGS